MVRATTNRLAILGANTAASVPADGTLAGDDVLPGSSVRLRDVFRLTPLR